MFSARLLGLPEHRVRVITRDVGGGFGQKVMPLREDMCVLLAARKLPAAVKWIEDRQENLLSAGQARHEHGTARIAFDDDGDHPRGDPRPRAGRRRLPDAVAGRHRRGVGMIFPGPYRVAKGTFSHASVFSNTVGRVAYRGPWAFETLAREVILDIAARRIGIDPAELRRRNLLRRGRDAVRQPQRHAVRPHGPARDAGAGAGDPRLRRVPGRAGAPPARRAATSASASPATPSRRRPAFGYYATEGATIRIEPSGKVNVYVAGGSTGNSLETTVVQLTADALGADIDDVHTIQGDTAVTPFGAGTGGSRSGLDDRRGGRGDGGRSCGPSSPRWPRTSWRRPRPTSSWRAAGRACAATRSAGVSFAELADIAYFQPYALPPGMPPGLEASGRYTPTGIDLWACATHVCTCEVDVTTGAVTLLRYIVGEDCGHMINPNVVEGQIAGGVVQGIGGALLEELAYDADGNPVATTFMDYLLPTAADVPLIEYGHVETAPGPGPGGYKGVGEGGAIGAPPAVVNAVADALAPFGVTITRLPLTPARSSR